jgi:hypothetical protein
MTGLLEGLFDRRGLGVVPGCLLLAVHWTVLATVGLVLALLLAFPFALVVSAIHAIGIPIDNKPLIFGVYVPAIAVLSLLAARRINRWIDRRFHVPERPATTDDDLLERVADIDERL